MSQPQHQHDVHHIPVSSGIPVLVRIAATIGLIMIFVMGGLVVFNSGDNHVWPAADSMKIKL